MTYKAKNLHQISDTPAGGLWIYNAGYDFNITPGYFNRAWKKLRSGDFILVNTDGGGAPTGSMLHIWATSEREVAFDPVARSFCECAACVSRRKTEKCLN